MSGPARLLGWGLSLVLLAVGCARLPQVREEILPAGPVLAHLLEREEQISSLKALAGVKVKSFGGSLRFQEAALVRPPSHLRLEALGLGGLTTFILATDGEWLYAHDLLKQEFVRAKATPDNLFTLSGLRAAPPHLIRILVGLPPLVPREGVLRSLGDGREVWLEAEEGRFRQKLWLEGQSLIKRGELYQDQKLMLTFRFEDLRELQGVLFPYRITVEQPRRLVLEVQYQVLELNAPVSSSSFTLPFPRDGITRILELGS